MGPQVEGSADIGQEAEAIEDVAELKAGVFDDEELAFGADILNHKV